MGKDLNGKELGKGISQHKNGLYMARFTNRFGERKYLYDSNLRELKKKYKKAKAEDELELNIVTNNVTLDEWYGKWIRLYKSNLRNNSVIVYDNTYNKHIRPFLGMYEISKIKNLHVQKHLSSMEKEHSGSVVLVLTALILKELFTTAQTNGLITNNPLINYNVPQVHKKEKYVPSKEEMALFLEWSKDHYLHNAFIIQVSTGLRPGELLGLMVQDIDFSQKTINVNRTLHYKNTLDDKKAHYFLGEPKTATSVRTVPMSSVCEEAIRRQLEQRKSIILDNIINDEFKDLLFFNKRGNPMNITTYGRSVKQVIRKINEELKPEKPFPDFSPHAFRHFFGTRCYEEKIDLKVIQKLLGHSSLMTTSDIYVHTTRESIGDALNKIELLQKTLL